MGLAGPKVKTKVGLDPRNTFWTTNTENFGHKYLSSLGWTPGTALGDKSSTYHASGHISAASHHGVKIVLKDDTLGIGAKKGAQDGECTGLLGLEGLLGRLNGDDAKVERIKMEEERRKHEWVGGRYGVRFVRGEVWKGEDFSSLVKLADKAKAAEEEKEDTETESDKKKRRKEKRKRGDDGEVKEKKSKKEKATSEDAQDKEERRAKRSKSRSKSKSRSVSVDEESSNDSSGTPSDESSKTKKRKMSTEADEDRPQESKKERKKRKKEEKRARKAEKKSRKEKEKARKEESSSSSEESDIETPAASGSATPVSTTAPQTQKRVLVGRHAIRARFIAAKRSAVMDAAALNEILMVKA